ncbi:uncharacterized protein [Triticum aestivum]|uniref:uncharacterized protein n=1 Tax=Triticum aestivum TaxID=4565 RepID=UPI001D00D1B7|nr:uncharacterized protein LOC123068087 [Triticum aestivum]
MAVEIDRGPAEHPFPSFHPLPRAIPPLLTNRGASSSALSLTLTQGDGAVARGSPFTDGAISSESELEEHIYVGEAARPARRRSVLTWFLTKRHEEEKIMVKEKGNEKGKGAGKDNAKGCCRGMRMKRMMLRTSSYPLW